MIEINLLPQELILKTKKTSGTKIEIKNFLIGIPAVFLILVLVHIYLGIVNISLSASFFSLDKKWKALGPQIKEMDSLKKEYNILTQDSSTIAQLNKSRINWAEKINLLSIKLPQGVWFNDLQVINKDFVLKGSVYSPAKQELTLINKLLSNLKESPEFFKDFQLLEMGTVQREVVGGHDVLNFSLNGVLK